MTDFKNYQTQEEIYQFLFITMKTFYKKHQGTLPLTDDKINRLSNIYAVKNTVKVWRAQWS